MSKPEPRTAKPKPGDDPRQCPFGCKPTQSKRTFELDERFGEWYVKCHGCGGVYNVGRNVSNAEAMGMKAHRQKRRRR